MLGTPSDRGARLRFVPPDAPATMHTALAKLHKAAAKSPTALANLHTALATLHTALATLHTVPARLKTGPASLHTASLFLPNTVVAGVDDGSQGAAGRLQVAHA